MAVTLNICLFKIQGQILCLIQRFICLNLKLYSAISDSKVKLFEQKIVFQELCLALKKLSGNVLTINGLDKYNVSK